MINNFHDDETEEIWDNIASKRARRRLPLELWPLTQQKLDVLEAADSLEDLRYPPGNRLEALKGHRKGMYAIRINNRFRICFQFRDDGVHQVEIVDYHSG